MLDLTNEQVERIANSGHYASAYGLLQGYIESRCGDNVSKAFGIVWDMIQKARHGTDTAGVD